MLMYCGVSGYDKVRRLRREEVGGRVHVNHVVSECLTL
jgi:hypothetical protein